MAIVTKPIASTHFTSRKHHYHHPITPTENRPSNTQKHGIQTDRQPGRAPKVRTSAPSSCDRAAYILTHHARSFRFAEPDQRHPTPSSSQYARKPVSPRPAENYQGRLSPNPPHNPAGHGAHTSYSQQQPQRPHYSSTMSPPPVAAAQRPAPVQNRPPPASRPPPSPAPGEDRDPTLLPLFRAVDKNGTQPPCSPKTPPD